MYLDTIQKFSAAAETRAAAVRASMPSFFLWVTLGNTISGTLFMATAYWFASGSSATIKAPDVAVGNIASDLES